MTKLREQELEFDFAGCRGVKFDSEGKTFPNRMCLVDFVVDEPSGRRLLIEVKDPGASTIPCGHVPGYVSDKGQLYNLVEAELVTACRDSWTILYLMAQDVPNNVFIAVIGTSKLAIEDALNQIANEHLSKKLHKEMDEPWKRPYVKSGILVNEDGWRKHFKDYDLKRVLTA